MSDRFALFERPAYHRADWGTAQQVSAGLWRVRLKNPLGQLMVNTYVWSGAQQVVVIDPGWPWTLDALEQALQDLDVAPSLGDVAHWVYTHTHIDHMGAAAILGRRFEAPHHTYKGAEAEFAQWHAFQDRMNDWGAWTQTILATAPAEYAEHEAEHLRQRAKRRTMRSVWGDGALRQVQTYDFGDIIEVAELRLHVIDARGHDPWHIALWDPEHRWLFAGDAVLAVPTPITAPMGDDLELYDATLRRLEGLGAHALFPGHGTHTLDAASVRSALARSKGFVTHYREGIRAILAKAGRPPGIYDVALQMTPDAKPLRPRTRWMVHVALCDAHARWLVERGEARWHHEDGPRLARAEESAQGTAR